MKARSIQIFEEKFSLNIYAKNIERVYRKVNDTKVKKKFNMLDIFIVLFLLVAMIIGYKYLKKTDTVSPNYVKVTYQFRSNEQDPEISQMIKEDTLVFDSVKNYKIGKIVKKEVVQSTRELPNEETGEFVSAPVENKEDVILTIEADAVIQGKDIIVDGQYDIKVGNAAYLQGKGYATIGYIVNVERLGD